MNKYIVNVREVWTQMVEVEAENEKQAKRKVSMHQGQEIEDTLEYSHTLGSEYWTVDKAD